LRFDLISGDWVVIATGRAKRPETFKREKRRREVMPKSQCPFCNVSEQEEPVLVFSDGQQVSWRQSDCRQIGGNRIAANSWTTIVVPNKFPAFIPASKLSRREEGPFYHILDAVGFHEVVITSDHKKQLAQFSIEQVKEVFDVYQERYRSLKKGKFVNHISIFHNHGKEAGASVSHPHSQIITTPLLDVDLKKALSNAKNYFKKHKVCIYCQMNEWERKSKTRIIFENESFLVLCPFASKSAFEVIVSPKKHLPYFEEITEKEKWQLAQAFKTALAKLFKALQDPAYNFYLHTAPCDGKKYSYYHWHWTILPKTSTWAGFEIGTRMEISTIEPERAAEYLRKQ
jgi:UDPglucose--hexose-1-phosphate uridylyltransferase